MTIAPNHVAAATHGSLLARRVMQRAEGELTVHQEPAWRSELPANVRSVACQCGSQNLDFRATQEPWPHWTVVCRRCAAVNHFPSRPRATTKYPERMFRA